MRGGPAYIENNLAWAILATLLCCIPTGIVSIYYATKVDALNMTGNTREAYKCAQKAKYWAIGSAIALPIGVFLYFIFVLMLAAI